MPDQRPILAIETSNPSAAEPGGAGPGVAIGVPGTSPSVLGDEPVGSGRHEDLIEAIDRLTRRLGLRGRDLGAVAVSIGPGGYTGLRTAVAAAKMLCEATGAACLAVPSALVAARARLGESPAGADAGRFGVALASKGETSFVTVFEGGRAAGPGRLAGAEDLTRMRLGILLADRFLPEAMRREAGRLGIEVRPPRLSARACFAGALTLEPIDPLALAPLYPREPEAVRLWQRRT